MDGTRQIDEIMISDSFETSFLMPSCDIINSYLLRRKGSCAMNNYFGDFSHTQSGIGGSTGFGAASFPFTSMVVPERVVTLVDFAEEIIAGIMATVAKASNSPTAVITEPSIIPRGGTKKPPTIIPALTKRHIRNAILEKRFFLILLG